MNIVMIAEKKKRMKDKIKYRNLALENLLRMKQSTLKKHVVKELCALGYDPVANDGYVFARGEFPVLLVAHMDTVHLTPVKEVVYDGPIISSPQGIGGDDRCGVYIILELLKEFDCSVVFTEDEEIGCVGAKKFVENEDIEVNYIIEFDRRGSNDCVFYSCDNPDFTNFVESTGFFKKALGSFSDICIIAPALGAAAVNLSCGYYSEHSVKETINLLEMNEIIEEAKILLDMECEAFDYIEEKYMWDLDYDDDEWFGTYTSFIASPTEGAKRIFHVYLSNMVGTQICVEVRAVSRYEAIGLILSNYAFCTIDDIDAIYED